MATITTAQAESIVNKIELTALDSIVTTLTAAVESLTETQAANDLARSTARRIAGDTITYINMQIQAAVNAVRDINPPALPA